MLHTSDTTTDRSTPSENTLPITSLPVRRIAVIGLLVTILTAGVTPRPVSAAPHWCECVEYVKNYFDLHGAAGNAKDMGPFLAAHGFRRSDTPTIGAVVILQPAYYSGGAGAIYGHTAIIESLAPAGSTGWFIGLRGANQSGKQFNGANCGNVTFKSNGPISRASRLASYWLPPRR